MANPYINLEDKELMLKYQDGDYMAFNVLYSRHKDKVYSYLSKRLHSQDEVDDLFQKVFTKLHKSRRLYSDKYEVLPWFYTITKSEFLDFIKKKKVDSVEFKEQYHGVNEETSENDFDLDSEQQLSTKEKEAIKERYHNDKDFKEIAELLQTSEANTRKLISRGLAKLRSKYQGRKI